MYDYEARANYSFCTMCCCGLQMEKPLNVAKVLVCRPPFFATEAMKTSWA